MLHIAPEAPPTCSSSIATHTSAQSVRCAACKFQHMHCGCYDQGVISIRQFLAYRDVEPLPSSHGRALDAIRSSIGFIDVTAMIFCLNDLLCAVRSAIKTEN